MKLFRTIYFEKKRTTIHHKKYFDDITNLPNINFLTRKCPLRIHKSCDKINCQGIINKTIKKAYVCIGIDNFRLINEAVGFAYGNEVLKKLGDHLSELLKNDLVTRLFGDEFLVIINYESHQDLLSKINEIFSIVNQSLKINHLSINISCSMGISLYPQDGICLEKLIKQAEMAMYDVKQNGKNHFSFYNEAYGVGVVHRFDIVREIRTALNEDQFILYYQPKVEIQTNKVTGLEALVRWNHPNRGIIYPNDFISIAEEKGMIKKLDYIVLDLACREIQRRKKCNKDIYPISINVSPVFFSDPNFIQMIDSVINKYQIEPYYISFEITEGVLLKDLNQAKDKLKLLKDRHIKIYIDDFGKGYSSLNYIKELDIDYLKIDKSFIDEIEKDQKVEKLIEFMVSLSKVFEFKVLSEGVEYPYQLEFLKKIGCDEYQGYLISPPKPIEELAI